AVRRPQPNADFRHRHVLSFERDAEGWRQVTRRPTAACSSGSGAATRYFSL
ncbi:MAG: hypothetical protein AVDCRST_MAG86-4019, partial [uncultured Truepera sp.]